MAVPLLQSAMVGAYVVGRHLRGVKRYPLVLMLEPLFRCNLACAGCGKIDYPAPLLKEKRMDQYEPSPFFTWSVHLDGSKEEHDAAVCQGGVYDRAVAAIKEA